MADEKRGPGRPATGVKPALNVRVAQTVQDAARAKAKQRGEPFAAYVERLLAEDAAR
ncbi:hypothetical protein [Micromonospora sp. NPDC004704]